MLGMIVMSALLAVTESPPTVQLDVVIARMKPGAGAVFKGLLLRRSTVPVEFKEGKPGAFAGVVPRDGGKVVALLQRLEVRGRCKVLAQPRLVTKSGQQASFLDGDEQAIPVPAGMGSVGVQFEEFGTRVNFLPTVPGNGRIRLEVEPEVNVLSPRGEVIIAGVAVHGRTTRRVHASVEMEPGQTFVIGGLSQKEAINEKHAVPGLCELPLVGELFRWETTRHEEYEVMVLVTPHVIAETRGAAGR